MALSACEAKVAGMFRAANVEYENKGISMIHVTGLLTFRHHSL